MFELTIDKQLLLPPLLVVAGAVDKKQSTPILSNILIKRTHDTLSLTATDLEIEMTARIPCESTETPTAITVPAKKIIDIIRSLDDNAKPTLFVKEGALLIKSGRSQFKLAT